MILGFIKKVTKFIAGRKFFFLKAIKKEDVFAELDFVAKFYCDDFHHEMIRMQLHVLAANFPPDESIYIHSIIKILKQIPASQRELMSEVCSLVSHISIMPATNAVREHHLHSSLRKVQNYLRSPMTEKN